MTPRFDVDSRSRTPEGQAILDATADNYDWLLEGYPVNNRPLALMYIL